jgi:hypothetical protein
MNVMSKSTNPHSDAARELRTKMQGRVVSRGDDDYARTRQIWSGAVENQPALFALCEMSADVQAAVRCAHVSIRSPCRSAVGDTTGRDAPCALTDASLTSAG